MNKRILATIATSLALTTGLSVISSNPVQAAVHSINSSYWNKTRTVVVKKKINFYKYDAGKYRVLKTHKTFKPGKKIKVRAAGEFKGWVLPGKAGSRYWWISERKNSNWMTEYHKKYKAGWSGNTYQSSNGSTVKIKKIQNIKINRFDSDPEYEVLVKGVFSNNGKAISADKFISDNLFIYPQGKEDDTLINWTDSSDLADSDKYRSDFEDSLEKTPKGYYGYFTISLAPDEDHVSDAQASSYTIDDLNGHAKTFSAQNIEFDLDDED